MCIKKYKTRLPNLVDFKQEIPLEVLTFILVDSTVAVI